MSREELAEKAEISLGSISRIEAGKQQPRGKVLDRIVAVFRMKPADFYGDYSNVSPAEIGAVKVPLIEYAQAVLFAGNAVPDLLGGKLQYILSNGDHSGMAFGLEIKGESMLPMFKEGDRILVDPAVTPGPGDYVIVSEKGGEVTFRKYRSVGTNESGTDVFELVPLNNDYATVRSDVCAVEIIGTMIEHRIYRSKR